MGEPVKGEGIANAIGARNVASVAAVVFKGWADVPAVDAVGCHVAALVGCLVDDDAGSWWGERTLVVIIVASQACVCR